MLGAVWDPAAAEPPKLFADPLFVDTRFMLKHIGQELPAPMLLPALTTSPAMLLQRDPRPAESWSPTPDGSAGLSAGYETAGSVVTEIGQAHRVMGPVEGWAVARRDRVLPYQDGADQRVNYGYDRINTQMALDWRPDARSRVSAYAMRDEFSDFRLPNYGLDAPDFRRLLGSAVIENRPAGGAFDRIEAGLNASLVTYSADNYTLRDRGALGLRQDAQFTYWRGQVRGDFTAGGYRGTVSLDGNVTNHDAHLTNRFSSEGLSAYRLPQVTTMRTGVAVSASAAPSFGGSLTAGLRGDLAHSAAGLAHEVPAVTGTGAAAYNRSPQQMWDTYYGPRKNAPDDLMLSGRLRYEYPVTAAGKMTVDASRLVRQPDPLERFAGSTGSAALAQVGNPELRPEAHHRLDLGAETGLFGWTGYQAATSRPGTVRLALGAWVDRVVDFITVDHARGQTGVLMSDGALIYRNVDVDMEGVSLSGWWQVAEGLGARAKLGWTRGQNLTDQRPLYQIPPLEGEVVVEDRWPVWDQGMANIGARLGFAGTQHRIDASSATGSGADTGGATAGYAVVDLFSGLALTKAVALTVGVTNLLDKRYHLHVNQMPQGPTTQPQRAPGRSLFVTASVSF
ncbi:MAG: TonB-dependent receptor domain-containing protein [Actinomycetota bacterium]